MTLVDFGTDSVDVVETQLALLEDGGVYMAYLDGNALSSGQSLSLLAYSRVHPGSEVQLYSSASIDGPSPIDPGIIAVGPVLTSELMDLRAVVDSGDPIDCPWRLEHLGRVRTVDDGQGTQTASGGVDTLVTVPYGGTFYLVVDVSAMEAGDTLVLRLRARGGDPSSSINGVLKETLSDAQTDGIFVVGPIVVHDSVVATLEQTAGTNRDYSWAILRTGE